MKLYEVFDDQNPLEIFYNIARKSKSLGEFSRNLSIDILQKTVFGFTTGDILDLDPRKLKIKWKDDWIGAYPYDGDVDSMPPIEVSYEKGKFFVEDGHHRLKTALRQKKKTIKCEVESIRDKVVIKLGFQNYDDMLKTIYANAHK